MLLNFLLVKLYVKTYRKELHVQKHQNLDTIYSDALVVAVNAAVSLPHPEVHRVCGPVDHWPCYVGEACHQIMAQL